MKTSAQDHFWRTEYDAVLFDFDGVLADTEPLHYACWQILLACEGTEFTWQDYMRDLSGYSGDELLLRLSKLGPTDRLWDVEHLYARKKALYRDLGSSQDLIPDAVVAFVQQLPILCGVVTSGDRADVEGRLRDRGLLDHFSAVICREDVNLPKPSPDGYNHALDVLGVRHVLAVEDSDAGIQSAHAAGIEVLRVPSPQAVPLMVAEKLFGRPLAR